jgi:hypothetical protein
LSGPAAVDDVVAELGVDLVKAVGAVDNVVAGRALEVVGCARAGQVLDAPDVVALAEHAVVGGAVLVDVDRPGIAVVAQGVGVRAAVEDVRAVGSCSQLQRVVAALAPEHVVAKAAGERVGAGAAGDLVDAAGAIKGAAPMLPARMSLSSSP